MTLEKTTRRGFFSTVFNMSAGFGAVYLASDLICDSATGYLAKKEKSDMKNVDFNERATSGVVMDEKINDVDFKLFGVAHTKDFAERNEDKIDDLVKNSSIVVSEGFPPIQENITEDGKVYFDKIVSFCEKYEKPVIHFDNWSDNSYLVETVLGAFGMLKATENVAELFDKTTRREFLSHIPGSLIGGFLFVNSQYGMSQRNHIDKLKEDMVLEAHVGFNHVIDRRNVAMTRCLIYLAASLKENDLKKGDYVLVNTGATHSYGMDYYLKNPEKLETKSKIYNYTYDLIDHNQVNRFDFKNGFLWVRSDL